MRVCEDCEIVMTRCYSSVTLKQGLVLYFCISCLEKRVDWGQKTNMAPWFRGLTQDMDPKEKRKKRPGSFTAIGRRRKNNALSQSQSNLNAPRRITSSTEEDIGPLITKENGLKRRSVSMEVMLKRRMSSTTTTTSSDTSDTSDLEEIDVGKNYVDPMSFFVSPRKDESKVPNISPRKVKSPRNQRVPILSSIIYRERSVSSPVFFETKDPMPSIRENSPSSEDEEEEDSNSHSSLNASDEENGELWSSSSSSDDLFIVGSTLLDEGKIDHSFLEIPKTPELKHRRSGNSVLLRRNPIVKNSDGRIRRSKSMDVLPTLKNPILERVKASTKI